jgi:hypothetical protein
MDEVSFGGFAILNAAKPREIMTTMNYIEKGSKLA